MNLKSDLSVLITPSLCVLKSLRPESEILGMVCVLRMFKAKHPQGQKHSYSYGGGVVKEIGRTNQNNLCRETW